MLKTPEPSTAERFVRAGWWAAVAYCVLNAGFAVSVALRELLSLVGLTAGGAGRTAPPLFVVHVLAGAIALTAGTLQLRFAGRLLARRPRLHRVIGRGYVWAAWVTSAGGLALAAVFEVGVIGTLAFGVWAVGWSATTAIALRHARARRIQPHRRWMVRSYAFCLVFATFGIWHPIVAALDLSRPAVYALALLLSIGPNVAVAELWLRRTDRGKPEGRSAAHAASSMR